MDKFDYILIGFVVSCTGLIISQILNELIGGIFFVVGLVFLLVSIFKNKTQPQKERKR